MTYNQYQLGGAPTGAGAASGYKEVVRRSPAAIAAMQDLAAIRHPCALWNQKGEIPRHTTNSFELTAGVVFQPKPGIYKM
jgi:hypothetical protein